MKHLTCKNSFGILIVCLLISLFAIESFSLKKLARSQAEGATTASTEKPGTKKIKVITVTRWVKPTPNVHYLTMKFLAKLLNKLGDTRSRTIIVGQLVKKCPAINFLEDMRKNIIDCKVIMATVKQGEAVQKKIALGCVKKIVDTLTKSCPPVLKNSPANSVIQKALYNLNNIKNNNLNRFTSVAKVSMKRYGILLKVYHRTIKPKLDKVLAEMKRLNTATKKGKKVTPKKATPKKAAPKKAAPKKAAPKKAAPKKRLSKKNKKKRNIKVVKKVKSLPKRIQKLIEKLPPNTPEDIQFLKDTKLTSLRSSGLASYIAKIIKKLASYQ